jgi:hypothetical protein
MNPLPAPVARFRDLAMADSPPRLESIELRTSGWMRRPRMPRIPLEIRMSHRLGREFVHEIRIGRGWLSFRFGLDAYVDGRGLMQIGPSFHTGPTFDQGALIALWGEALTFPQTWQSRDDIAWGPIDHGTATLIVPGPEGEIPITVGFDARTGLPAWCEADRYKGDGPKVRWRGTFGDWHRFDGGVLAPGRFEARWADEPEPWIDLRITSVGVDVPVDATLDTGRRRLRSRNGPRAPLPRRAAAFRLVHAGWAVIQVISLTSLWVSAVRRRRGRGLPLAVGLLLAQGAGLVVGRGDCPLGPVQRSLGDPVPLFELVLPPRAAKAAIPVLALVTVASLAAVALRGPRPDPR